VTGPTAKPKLKKKEPQPIKLTKIDWKDPVNRYQIAENDKIEFDDRTIERWTWSKPVLSNITAKETDEEDEEEFNLAFEDPGQDATSYVDRMLR
jgi:hypothetical protein